MLIQDHKLSKAKARIFTESDMKEFAYEHAPDGIAQAIAVEVAESPRWHTKVASCQGAVLAPPAQTARPIR